VEFFLILLWLVPLWLFGWICLPLARRVFATLPDGGLACGRILGFVLVSLLAFWLASFHVLSLKFAPLLFALPIICAAISLRETQARAEFTNWLRENKRALIFSDLVFLFAFAFFLWIRLRNPALSDLEKPMDAALMGSLARAEFLPFQNPWQSGAAFTNYYYFGHLMSALLARAFATPNYLAYNLAQPLFCAFFISALWSLCAALTLSRWRGLGAALIVALLGHFEPLRQIADKRALQQPWWPLDWWKTSRVIYTTGVENPNTINEYPAFTMAIGDAHGHFFALSLSAVFLALCFCLFALRIEVSPNENAQASRVQKKRAAKNATKVESKSATEESTPEYGRTFHRRAILILLGALLGAIAITNTWDVPLLALLGLVCALLTSPLMAPWKLPRDETSGNKRFSRLLWIHELLWCFAPPLLSRVVAWPFTRLSSPNISGAEPYFWLPPTGSFFLLWGGMLVLVFVAAFGWKKRDGATRFSLAVIAIGFLALAAPYCFYIRGVFGDGDFRHQDTVFKFGLQAWLLLGTASACGALTVWTKWKRIAKIAFLAFFIAPVLCSACVVYQRAWISAPRNADGGVSLSLDGARALPEQDRAALRWLDSHARSEDVVLEAVGGGAYSEFARVSSLTGIVTPLGWIQHVRGWGASVEEIARRHVLVETVFRWPNDAQALAALKELKVRWIFVGDVERRTYQPKALVRLRARLGAAYSNGDTFIAEVK